MKLRSLVITAGLFFSLITALPALAQKSGGGKKSAAAREKTINREARSKKGDATRIDFEETDIGGQRKTPLGTVLNNTKPDKNYEFVKIRLRWHPEMVQSASSLESSGKR